MTQNKITLIALSVLTTLTTINTMASPGADSALIFKDMAQDPGATIASTSTMDVQNLSITLPSGTTSGTTSGTSTTGGTSGAISLISPPPPTTTSPPPTTTTSPPPPPAPCIPAYSSTQKSCLLVAGTYGVPSNYKNGTATLSTNSCTGTTIYLMGCSASSPVCTTSTTSKSCSVAAGNYSIPITYTFGTATLSTNSCTGTISYSGGCSGPTWSSGSGISACAPFAGVSTYNNAPISNSIPAGYTIGSFNYTYMSYGGVIKSYSIGYDGCSMPLSGTAPCSALAGVNSYLGAPILNAIPSGYTSGNASYTGSKNVNGTYNPWTIGANNCSVPYSPPMPVCTNTTLTAICQSGGYLKSTGSVAMYNTGIATLSKNSCNGNISYVGGCTLPPVPGTTSITGCSYVPSANGIPAVICQAVGPAWQ